jgi:hypothetical protein
VGGKIEEEDDSKEQICTRKPKMKKDSAAAACQN